MSTQVIEALSLSSLTTLLSNPPQYPRNPALEAREPLVLYIVRVPGSKDVVLTPLKPPTKASVSLDAIQSSLYYLHVETPDDEAVKESLEAERRASEENRPPPVPIQRKPLPSTIFANYPPSRRPPSPPKSYPDYQPVGENGDNQYERFAARGSHVRLSADKAGPQLRPQGARPMPIGRTSYQSSTSGAGDEGATDPLRLRIPNVPSEEAAVDDHSDPRSSESSATRSSPDGFSNITIIRRDPTSGVQWNVGSIRVGARRHHMASLQPVEVNLTTPGYSRFAQTPDSASPVKRASFDMLRSPSPTKGNSFWRYVGFRTVADEKTSLQDVRVNSNDFSERCKSTEKEKRKARQVYSFTSPWQGMCILSNGVDGKSLRLRHSLPTNSNVIGEQGAAAAELRLNLPWSILRTRDVNRQAVQEPEKLPISQLIGKSKKQQFRRSMQVLKADSKQLLRELRDGKAQPEVAAHEHKPVTYEQAGEDARLSLKLGREKAGGGFMGDSAKLGKLILEDEGLKMGDLVVAACMGIWWQHWSEPTR